MKDLLKAFVTAPVGQGPLTGAQLSVDGDNPVCGDKLRFSLKRENDGRLTIGFVATACPATIAIASCAVQLYSGEVAPAGPPFVDLRQKVESLGGLSNFEGHALSLVEDVLHRVYRSEASGD